MLPFGALAITRGWWAISRGIVGINTRATLISIIIAIITDQQTPAMDAGAVR
jgi:hypothetical protein